MMMMIIIMMVIILMLLKTTMTLKVKKTTKVFNMKIVANCFMIQECHNLLTLALILSSSTRDISIDSLDWLNKTNWWCIANSHTRRIGIHMSASFLIGNIHRQWIRSSFICKGLSSGISS